MRDVRSERARILGTTLLGVTLGAVAGRLLDALPVLLAVGAGLGLIGGLILAEKRG